MRTIYKLSGGLSGTGIGLWLYRGLPGSGKSTQAKRTADMYGGFDIAADDYFAGDDGQYNFDPSRLKDSHQWCRDYARSLLAAGKLVCVANTFSQQWEIQPYLDMAKELNIPVIVTHCCGDYGNVHNVPDHAIIRMRERWEPVQGEHHIYPDEISDALRYEIARNELDCADNHRAYRLDDDWLKASYKGIERRGCCGSFETKVKLTNGEEWMIGCNYGH